MRQIDAIAREKIVISGDLSKLKITFGKGCDADVVIGEKKSFLGFRNKEEKIQQELQNQGKEYDGFSESQWTETDYKNIEIDFMANGKIAVFTFNYGSSRNTSSDSGIYESERPEQTLAYIDINAAAFLSYKEAVEFDRMETGADVEDFKKNYTNAAKNMARQAVSPAQAEKGRGGRIANKSVFVSSTFRDMQAERDALRDLVLPRVNEFAARYGRAVEFIDLRWGVDTTAVSEEEQNRKVLRTCLDEIERSRPFFIGIIGDRYGWVPPREDMEAALESARFSVEDMEKSVTALEIEYGALRADDPPICLFYFREIPDYGALPEDTREIYRDGEIGLTRLSELKRKIRARFGQDVKDYSVKASVTGLVVSENWADTLTQDIIAKLRAEWGEAAETPPDWKERERNIQDAFRESRTSHFAGRIAEVAALRDFCLGDDKDGGIDEIDDLDDDIDEMDDWGDDIDETVDCDDDIDETDDWGDDTVRLLMLQGEAGSGKSGLLCKVMDEIESDCLLLPFCCGLSPLSSLTENMLRFFISILCVRLGRADESDDVSGFDGLSNRFLELVRAACEHTRVVAVVDALDQIYGGDARRMTWIDEKMPRNFRLLCSIIDGPEVSAIKQLNGEVRQVSEVSEADMAEIIFSMAASHHKQISAEAATHIFRKRSGDGGRAARNPLYLSLIVQDLVMMDRNELEVVQKYMADGMSQPDSLAKYIGERVDETPGDAEGAYLAILGRLERLIGRDFVRAAMGLIAVSRNGLREMDLGGAFSRLGLAFNTADFSWLRQMMRGHFSQGDLQQWDFSHPSLRRTLKKDRLDELLQLNYALVSHLRAIVEADDFAAREIMHHLSLSNMPEQAAGVIIEHAGRHGPALRQGLAAAYAENDGGGFLLALPAGAKDANAAEYIRLIVFIRNILPFLPENTRPFRIELMLAVLAPLSGWDDGDTLRETAICEVELASLYNEMGETEKSGERYKSALRIREDLYERSGSDDALHDLSLSLIELGAHHTLMGWVEDAGKCYRKAADAAEKLNEHGDGYGALEVLSSAYSKLGEHLVSLDQDDDASPYLVKSYEVANRLCERNKTDAALRCKMRALNNVGAFLIKNGESESARGACEKVHEEYEKLYTRTGTSAALRDLADATIGMGRYLVNIGKRDEAGIFYRKALDMRERLYEQSETATDLQNLVGVLIQMGDYCNNLQTESYAMDCYRKAADEAEKLYEQSGTASALRDLSVLYSRLADHWDITYHEHKEHFLVKAIDVAERLYERSKMPADLQRLFFVLDDMGDMLLKLKRMDEAEVFIKRTMKTSKKILELKETSQALTNLMWANNGMGNWLLESKRANESLKYYENGLALRERIYERAPSATKLRSMADAYKRMGNLIKSLGKKQEATAYYIKSISWQERLCEQTGAEKDLRDLAVWSDQLGDFLSGLDQGSEAAGYFEKSLAAWERLCERTGTDEDLGKLINTELRMIYCLKKLDRADDAVACYEKAISVKEQLYERERAEYFAEERRPSWRREPDSELRLLCSMYYRPAEYLISLGRVAEAEKYYQRPIDTFTDAYEQDGGEKTLQSLADALYKMSGYLKSSGREKDAKQYDKKYHDVIEQLEKLKDSL